MVSVDTITYLTISYDAAKRKKTRRERGLDFSDAALVFYGANFEFEDQRRDYGERRVVCIGRLSSRMVVICYVQRGTDRHVFSMRKANDREKERYASLLEV